MNIRYVKVDNSVIEKELARIGDLLTMFMIHQGIDFSKLPDIPIEVDPNTTRVFYEDEDRQIIEEHLRRQGRTYKERKK